MLPRRGAAEGAAPVGPNKCVARRRRFGRPPLARRRRLPLPAAAARAASPLSPRVPRAPLRFAAAFNLAAVVLAAAAVLACRNWTERYGDRETSAGSVRRSAAALCH